MESELKEKVDTINSMLKTSNSLYTAYATATRLSDKLHSLRDSISTFNDAFIGELIRKKSPDIFHSKLKDIHKDFSDVNDSLKEIIYKIDRIATEIIDLEHEFIALSEEKFSKII